MKVRRPISFKLILMTSAMVILTAACTAALSLHHFSSFFTSEVQAEADRAVDGMQNALDNLLISAESMASVLANTPSIHQAVLSGDTEVIRRELMFMSRENDESKRKVDFITITNGKGIVLVRTHSDRTGDSIAYQYSTAAALGGKSSSAVEEGTVVLLTARAATPVMDSGGRVAGVVSAGYDLSKDGMMDNVKQLFGTEVTLFGNDMRYATSVVQNGKRAVGTKLDPVIADRVLKKGEIYRGQAEILGAPYLTTYKPLLSPGGKILGALSAGKCLLGVNSETRRFLLLLTVAAGSLVLLFIIFAGVFARRITRPLANIVEIVQCMERGDLSLSVDTSIAGKGDETEILVAAFSRMVESQENMIKNTRKSAMLTAEKAKTLISFAESTAEAMKQIESQVEHLAELASNNACALEEGEAGVQEIASAASSAARASTEGADAALKTANISREAGKKVSETIAAIEKLVEQSSSAVSAMEKVGSSVETITNFIGRISSIADQTNLLALNAAIEAARAGETGRGFAVVAEEVRALAEESNRTAQEAKKIIEDLGKNALKSHASMTEVDRIADGTTIKAKEAGKQLEEALLEIARISDGVQSIAAAAQQQAAASEQTAAGIDTITKAMEDEIHSVETIRNATMETTATSQMTADESRSMAEEAGGLLRALAYFRISGDEYVKPLPLEL